MDKPEVVQRQIELLWEESCPNVKDARATLVQALVQRGAPVRWTEWRQGDPDAPAHVMGYGSPTILVDGVDVAGLAADEQGVSCCRLYFDEAGRTAGVPRVSEIVAALESRQAAADLGPSKTGLARSFGVIPAIGVALLPKVACPACWPAYAGLLSAMGVGFLMDASWLFPLTAAFLVIALFALAFRARNRRGFGPLGVGSVGALGILVGKFQLDNEIALYVGVGMLVVASLWNGWPQRASKIAPCCATAGTCERGPGTKINFTTPTRGNTT